VGGPPVWRSNRGGTFRPDPQATYRPWRSVGPQPGTRGRGPGPAFKRPQRRRRGTRLAGGDEGDHAPWLLRTELPPDASAAGWEGLRAWLAPPGHGSQRAGGQGQRTRLTPPARAARLGLAVAVATRWRLRGGGAAEETSPARTRLAGTAALPGQRRQRRATRRRVVRVVPRGWSTIRVALLDQAPLPRGPVLPEPWPRVPGLEVHRVVPDPEVQDHVAA
jgi:hypothetical protein